MKKTFKFIALGLIALAVVSTFWFARFCQENKIFISPDGDLAKILKFEKQSNTKVFDTNHNEIGEFFSTYRIYTPVEKLPKRVVQSVLAVEDRNFYHHPGFDIKAMARVALSIVKHGKPTHGASTITQQLVRSFCLTRKKVLVRKLRELYLSYKLEQRLSKNKILDLYLNNMFFGNGAYGITAAAWRYFGKKPNELSDAETSILVGLLQSPSRLNPKKHIKLAKKRQQTVLRSMVSTGMLSKKQAVATYRIPLKFKEYKNKSLSLAPYFLDHVLKEIQVVLGKKYDVNKGLKVYTTLDLDVQRLAQKSLHEYGKTLKKVEKENQAFYPPKQRVRLEAGILGSDPRTGAIKVMVGGRDYTKSQFNRTTQALRSPGSAIKPAVYLSALEGGMKWQDSMYIDPVRYDDYRPKNSGTSYMTESTILKSFYQSINTPTVELSKKIGLGKVIKRIKSLGIHSPMKEELGTVLGSSDVTMMDMLNMYGTFANLGSQLDPYSIEKITDINGEVIYQKSHHGNPVIGKDHAFMMLDGFKGVMKYGTGYRFAELGDKYVGKTGTSNDGIDNWFCGFAPEFLAVVWVGTDHNLKLKLGYGGSKLALPLWANFVRKVDKKLRVSHYKFPEHFVKVKINPKHGYISDDGVDVHFIKGTEPTKTGRESPLGSLSILGNYRGVFDE